MMARTQVVLDRESQKRAMAKAHHLGVSFAEYVRRLVAKDIGQRTPAADPSVIFNLGHSGGSDVARDEDAMLGQAVAARVRRKSP